MNITAEEAKAFIETIDLTNTYFILVKSPELMEAFMNCRFEVSNKLDHEVYYIPDFDDKGIECLTKEDIERYISGNNKD